MRRTTRPTRKLSVDFGNSSTALNIQITSRKDEFDHFNWNILQQVDNPSISVKERRTFAKIYASNHREAVTKFGNDKLEEFLSPGDLEALVNKDPPNGNKYEEWSLPHKGQLHLRQDHLLHFPYDNFEDVLTAIAEEAQAMSQITLSVYRLADQSKVVQLLAVLLHQGIQVNIFIEPNARGNEANNIEVANQLKVIGAKVIIGKSSKKVHAKFIHIQWRDGGMTSLIMTGNLNEVTAKCYEDYCLITSDPEITSILWDIVLHLEDGFLGYHNDNEEVCFTKLNAVTTILRQIYRQIMKGSDGYLLIKCNSITDPALISVLEYAASQGVKINVICRGECCWKPISQNVTVHRFIHKYLEHSRVYIFGKTNPEIYLGSLDLATHKLYERFELLCRVKNPDFKKEIMETMHKMLRDQTERHYVLKSVGRQHQFERLISYGKKSTPNSRKGGNVSLA